MSSLLQTLTRTSAFLQKENFEILRQPRLLISLILGPFLILLIFGLGYRNEARSLRTVFVVPQENSALVQEIEENASTLGPQLVYRGVLTDQEQALRLLETGQVDVVAIAPADASEKIQANQQATFILYHREVDPLQVDYVKYFGQVYIDEVNRRVLLDITQAGQSEASDVAAELSAAKQSAAAMRQALEAGDTLLASQHQSELSGNISAVELAVGASLGLLNGVRDTIGTAENNESAELLSLLNSVTENANALEDAGSSDAALEQLTSIEQDIEALEAKLGQFTRIDPNVLIRPFTSEARSIAPSQPRPSDFYAPAVIALLLQHLAVTIAALSIVRERSVGTMELFRVSPLSAGETLFGKYLSYLLFGGIVAAALTVLLVFGLRVPMLGNWFQYVLVAFAILFTSLGVGFIISLISQTDSQAVQLTMIVLLTSVFFSGFLMSLDLILPLVRVISWALPTTYGIVLLRDILLRGLPANLILMGGLVLIGIALYGIAWLLLRRLISIAQQ
jgi:ABC-2 type transport system permease protein